GDLSQANSCLSLISPRYGADRCGFLLRIPAKPITDSNLMAIRIPRHADHYRSEATRACFMMRK
ncbi:MAG: hypothetical protein Q7U97_02570, partial [Rhodocyclaceae bacterium]|nr:hypothetical protein [Rhodocyclaceae bacterium]